MKYLHGFDTKKLPIEERDVLIIGSGIAGLATALYLKELGLSPLIVTQGEIGEGNTPHAQGGIASALSAEDTPDLHLKDTMATGDGLVDEHVARVFIYEGVERTIDLIRWGVKFEKEEDGFFKFAQEGGHTRRRILYVGDETGEAIQRVLSERVLSSGLEVRTFTKALELLSDGEQVYGALLQKKNGERYVVFSKVTVLATGGASFIYSHTTNPSSSDGYGMVMALRAGARLTDLEFVQFHPTVLYEKRTPRLLISEAVRGEGAVVLDIKGERFLHLYHPLAELAPRDVVSRAMWEKMYEQGTDHLFLDMRPIEKKGVSLEKRFPSIFKNLMKRGFDPRKEPLPISPAAHYFIGGVDTDIFARTTLKRLYAVGEVACTRVHGADRLASNSLLEGMVFGAHAAYSVFLSVMRMGRTTPKMHFSCSRYASDKDFNWVRERVRQILWAKAGIKRDKKGLKEALKEFGLLIRELQKVPFENESFSTAFSSLLLAYGIVYSALWRKESRGCHYRSDFPKKSNRFKIHSKFSMEDLP